MTHFTVDDFNYILPDALIAQFPATNRTESRLLVVPQEATKNVIHTQFPAFLSYINPGDLLILNDTKVIPARLHGQKESGGRVSCLIERIVDDYTALAHLGASHPPKIGATIRFENAIDAQVIAREDSLFMLKFSGNKSIFDLLADHGHLPLPPYIARDVAREDWERYQTVYAKHWGAVAAPTAGLHFDETVFAALKDKKVELGFLTLHVGAGTFQPVRVDNIAEHTMHRERIVVSDTLCAQIEACHARGSRVIAVGTTVVRALESAALSGKIQPYSGDTRIFITPGFHFQVVDMLLTNFHLPKSTLLMLVSAFAGFDRVMTAYKEAVLQQYRFFSYGDAMLLYRATTP